GGALLPRCRHLDDAPLQAALARLAAADVRQANAVLRLDALVTVVGRSSRLDVRALASARRFLLRGARDGVLGAAGGGDAGPHRTLAAGSVGRAEQCESAQAASKAGLAGAPRSRHWVRESQPRPHRRRSCCLASRLETSEGRGVDRRRRSACETDG